MIFEKEMLEKLRNRKSMEVYQKCISDIEETIVELRACCCPRSHYTAKYINFIKMKIISKYMGDSKKS